MKDKELRKVLKQANLLGGDSPALYVPYSVTKLVKHICDLQQELDSLADTLGYERQHISTVPLWRKKRANVSR